MRMLGEGALRSRERSVAKGRARTDLWVRLGICAIEAAIPPVIELPGIAMLVLPPTGAPLPERSKVRLNLPIFAKLWPTFFACEASVRAIHGRRDERASGRRMDDSTL